MADWTVETYRDPRGRKPIEEYLDTRPIKDRARVLRMFVLLRENGPMLRMPHARHIQGKLWELRIDGRPNSYRVLYAALPGRLFLLLHIFAKKTDKTPVQEIAVAENRLASYRERTNASE